MDATQLVPWIFGGVGMLVGIAGWMRNTRTDGSWMGTVNAKLDSIMGELARLGDVRERVAVAETSLKSLHKRVDALESKNREE